MKKLLSAYKEIINIFWKRGKRHLIFVCISTSFLSGILGSIGVYAQQEIINKGIAVAKGDYYFQNYVVILCFFVICAIFPQICSAVINLFVYPECQLFFRTTYRGELLKKLKCLEFKHFENDASMEIIDKAYHRAEEAALHLVPQYICRAISALVCVTGVLVQLLYYTWWMAFTILIPYIVETYLIYKNNFDIYQEMESYWNQERQYGILEGFLKEKDSTQENKLNQSSDFMINTYRKRLNKRNREYEKYYYLYLRKIISNKMISKLAQVANAIILFAAYNNGSIDVGQLIAYTTAIFTSLWIGMDGVTDVIKWSGHHINSYDYYHKYFELSEESEGGEQEPLNSCIEFRHVSFCYPGTEKTVIDDVSFVINPGEKISIVGENGEGKTTLIKLLLGLYKPDKGEILVGGERLEEFSAEQKTKIFGTIFQDFNKYALTLRENISIGGNLSNDAEINDVIRKAKVDRFLDKLPGKIDTLLTKKFADGVDLSGGEWQRVAIARALMGNKPILILDEPTSQLDPMAESKLYSEFKNLSKDKTSIFITHRLGSTMITDRILVLSRGRIAEEGTHQALMNLGGIYADMFQSQKKWYVSEVE